MIVICDIDEDTCCREMISAIIGTNNESLIADIVGVGRVEEAVEGVIDVCLCTTEDHESVVSAIARSKGEVGEGGKGKEAIINL